MNWCSLIGHKTKLKGQSEQFVRTVIGLSGNRTTLYVPWCYRCQHYVFPPLSLTLVLKLFPD